MSSTSFLVLLFSFHSPSPSLLPLPPRIWPLPSLLRFLSLICFSVCLRVRLCLSVCLDCDFYSFYFIISLFHYFLHFPFVSFCFQDFIFFFLFCLPNTISLVLSFHASTSSSDSSFYESSLSLFLPSLLSCLLPLQLSVFFSCYLLVTVSHSRLLIRLESSSTFSFYHLFFLSSFHFSSVSLSPPRHEAI